MLWKRIFTLVLVFSILLTGSLVLAQAPVNDPAPPADAPRTVVPVLGLPSDVSQIDGADVMLVIDRSGSMMDAGKLDAAIAAASQFVDLMDLTTDQVGLVSFEYVATLDHQLSQDGNSVKAAISSLVASGGTNIADGIMTAQWELGSSRHISTNIPAMIVLTDGVDLFDPTVAAANACKNAGTVIFSIALGTGVDEALVKAIASDPDFYYYAPDASDLAQIYATISEILPFIPLEEEAEEEMESAGYETEVVYRLRLVEGEPQTLPPYVNPDNKPVRYVITFGGTTLEFGTTPEDKVTGDESGIVWEANPAKGEAIEPVIECVQDCDPEGTKTVVAVGKEKPAEGPPPVPEASTILLMASGLTSMAGYIALRRRARGR